MSLNKIQSVVFFCILIVLSYVFQIYYLEVDKFYLSFSYNTDPINNYYLTNIKEQYLVKKLNFTWFGIFVHFFFLKIFTFEYFFISAIILKICFFSLFCFLLNKTFSLDTKKFFITALIIFIFFMTNFGIFYDRLPRPQITNIYFCISFFYLYALSINKKINNLDFIILGIFSCFLFFENTWSFIFLIPLYFYSFIKIKNIKNFLFLILSGAFASLIYLDSTLNILINSPERLMVLGTKEIYNTKNFLFDYYDQILFAKKNILLFFLILINCFFLKDFKVFWLSVFSIILSPIIIIIIGKTIQSYHFVKSSHEILIYFTIYSVVFSLKKFDFKNKVGLYLTNLLILLVFCIGVFNYNNWIYRSHLTEKYYSDVFQELKKIPRSCIIVTNDLYLKSFAQIITRHKVFPEELVITNNLNDNIVNTIEKHFFTTKSILDKNNIEYDDYHLIKLLVLISHNFFISTRSTSNNIVYEKFYNEINELNNVMSLNPWDDTIIKIILDRELLKNKQVNRENVDNNYFLIFNLKKNKYLSKNNFKLTNKCLE